ncbi:unnamed protein product [Trifolium pratense]|uniref:Uncharacterized protein n=1 Tax=Trifolium pratense TaxID=57577 RepID=A0ACB0LRC1_TRIPR|nr:unnamed protein product [Trifolium pratense]
MKRQRESGGEVDQLKQIKIQRESEGEIDQLEQIKIQRERDIARLKLEQVKLEQIRKTTLINHLNLTYFLSFLPTFFFSCGPHINPYLQFQKSPLSPFFYLSHNTKFAK